MITLNAQSCRDALKGLRQICNGKSTMPVLGYLFIEATQDRFTITANNLTEALQFRKNELECGIGSILVPFEALNRTLKNVRKGTFLTFSEEGKTGSIQYDDGTLKGSVPFDAMDSNEFPVVALFAGKAKVELTKEAVAGLLEAQHSASTSENRYILNSVCLESTRIVATDGRQLYSRNSFDMDIKDQLLMPLSKVMKVLDPDQPAEITFSDASRTRGTLIQGPWHWHFKTVEGNYPNYKQVIPDIKKYGTTVTFSDDDAEAILKAPIAPTKRGGPVSVLLLVLGNKVALHCGSKVRQSIPFNATASGPDTHVAFNIAYLQQSLKQGFRALRLKSENDPLVMTDGNRMHLFMPFKIKEGDYTDLIRQTSTQEAQTTQPQPIKPMAKKQQNGASNGAKTSTALDLLNDEVNAVKEVIKAATSQLNGLQSVVRDAVKERRDLEKEYTQIKKSIRSLQSVEL